MTKIFRNTVVAGALFGAAAFAAMPAIALEGDVDVHAPAGTDVHVDTDRRMMDTEPKADVEVHAKDDRPYDARTTGTDHDSDTDIGEPGATVDIE